MLENENIEVLTKKRFTALVEKTVKETKLSYMDAIMYIVEKNNLEVEDIVKYISPVIKNKLEAEAMDLHLLPRGGQLPI